MKINFQYFAVKYVASVVGYTDEEAQLVSSMCQFISDNNQDAKIYTNYASLSQGIIDNNLFTGSGDHCTVPLLLTALESYDDLKALSDKDLQEKILIPFEYFPAYQIEEDTDYLVKPISDIGDNDLFAKFFKDAKDLYSTPEENGPEGSSLTHPQKNALVRLGILMHILSNTFIHEPFNGYTADKNALILNEAYNSVTYENITSHYTPDKYKDYPNVGSVRLGGADSDYCVQFFAQNTIDKRKSLTRVNEPIFKKAGRGVYNFLMLFKNKRPSQQDWENSVYPNLQKALNTSCTSINDLQEWWSKVTPFQYHYEAEACKASLVRLEDLNNPEKQGYFDFLVTVDHIRKSVIKSGGVSMETHGFSTAQISCEVENPNFDGTDLTVNTNVSISKKLDCIGVVLTVIEAPSGIQIVTKEQQFKNASKFKMDFTLPIPLDNKEYDLNIDFSWKENGINKSFTYSDSLKIKGNNSIIATKNLVHPCSSTGKEVVQVINGTDSGIGNYKYPLNDNYTAQDGSQQLDLYLPIEFELQLIEHYKILKLDNYSFTLKESPDKVLTYCNNKKYINTKVDKEAGSFRIKATEEWKNQILTKPYTLRKASLIFELDVQLEVISSDEEGYRIITLKSKDGAPLSKNIDFLWNFQ